MEENINIKSYEQMSVNEQREVDTRYGVYKDNLVDETALDMFMNKYGERIKAVNEKLDAVYGEGSDKIVEIKKKVHGDMMNDAGIKPVHRDKEIAEIKKDISEMKEMFSQIMDKIK